MGLMGLYTGKAPAGMRSRRLLAFVLDVMIVLAIVFMVYNLTGEPDFFAVRAAMDAAQATGGQDQALTNAMFTEFNRAYGITLLIAFVYEALTLVVLNGSTIGKRMCGLQIVPQNPDRSRPLHMVLLCVRSALKMLSIYLFQGFPFIICCLTIFTNPECRTGFDAAVKTVTVRRTAG